jgi:endonuclease YncB( thermonuclease family)
VSQRIQAALRALPVGSVTPPRIYPEAKVAQVVDGDTLDVLVSGLDVDIHVRMRLIGVNAAEHGTPAGDAATAFVRDWCVATGWAVQLETVKTRTGTEQREKYGRWLAGVRNTAGQSLASALIEAGHALPWDGKGPRPT